MSKSRKDGVDWKSGPEALFRAVRDEHEAGADDYARVEAELARRIAAGAVPKVDVDMPVVNSAANLSRAFTPSTVAKLGIGVLLLAAGSFGVARMLNVGSSVDSRRAPSLPLPAAEVGRAPVPTTTEGLDTPQEQSSARVALAGSGAHLTQPSASHSVAATTPAGANAAKLTSLRAPANVAARVPRASAKGRSSASLSTRATARDAAEPTHAQVAANASERAKRMPASVAAPGSTEDASEQAVASEAAKRMPANVAARSSAKGPAESPSASVAARASATEAAEATAASVAARDASTRQLSVRPRKQDNSAPQPRAATALDTESAPAVAQATTNAQTRPAAIRSDQDDARAELALIERMHAAMRAAKPADALELCAEHAKRWPRGVFAEEREAVSAIASCALRADDAVARSQLFLRKHPRAPTAARVAAACAPLSAATKPASTH